MASEVRFAEIKKMLERKGYFLERISGSHHIFKKPGVRSLPIPVHRGKVHPAYVRMIQKLEA
ncbi:MAG: type II toxin-antitoxin system HicA family toxin [Planctomycetaceae bacterium]|nr:type II toxin-antitoxin system HicA family toxin [Planctomycetaceae bacterium]